MRPHLDAHVAAVARRQGGVLHHAQLERLGLGKRGISHRIAAGRLEVVHRGVYAVGGAELGRRGRWSAALLLAGDAAILDLWTGAVAYGLLEERDPTVHVTVPGHGGPVAHDGVVVRRVRDLERSRFDGWPVAPVHRVLLGLARHAPERHVDKALREADRRGLLDVARVRAMLAARRGRPGVPLLTDLLAAHGLRGITLTDSALEDLLLPAFDGLPAPLTQVKVLGRRADFLWPADRLVLEADGWETHRDRASFHADRRWDRRLRDHGWTVERVTHADAVEEPQEVAALVARRLGVELGT